MIKYIVTFLLLCILTACKKEVGPSLDLEVNIPFNSGKIISLKDKSENYSIKPDIYNISNTTNLTNNYAYPDLIKLKNGKLLLVAQYSDKNIEDFDHGKIVISESSDNGENWTNFREINPDFPGSINAGSPSLVQISDSHIILTYGVKYSLNRIDIYLQESKDGGKNWSNPKIIYKSNVGYQIMNNARTIIHGNKILIPVSYPRNGSIKSYWNTGNNMVVFLYSSDDFGNTWEKSSAISANYAILEPGLTVLKNSNYLMNLRTDNGSILFARSKDSGKKWTFEESNFNSPSSPQTIKGVPNSSNLIMIWNDNDKNVNVHGGNRSPLSLAISRNNGYDWDKIINLESFNNSQFDFAYSSVLVDNKYVFTVYNQKNISKHSFSLKLARINRKDLNL